MTNKKTIKTGILSGSFNPIHTGHLILAQYMTQYEDLDEIWFVVSPHNPLKDQNDLTDENLRLEMTRLAVEGFPAFKCCDIEYTLPTPSYTVHTLNELKKKHPEREFTLIIGADNWLIFDKWKDYKEILSSTPILIYPRTGYPIKEKISYPDIKLTSAPCIEISSTFIRNAIRENKNMNFFLPENVYKYILCNNLYK